MNRSSFALFVALLIHFVFLVFFWFLGTITPDYKKHAKQEEKRLKVSLREMPKKQSDSGVTKEKQVDSKIAPPMPKGSQLKKIVKSTKSPYINYKKTYSKPTPPIKIDSKPIVHVKKIDESKKYLKLKEKKDDPMSWMYEDRSSQEKKKEEKRKSNGIGLANHTIKELYGSKFGELTPGQQKYILNNQEIMRRITQQVLTRVASVNLRRDLNVNRTNVIEFYLHPNGDMTDFRFLKNSGYSLLDDTTKETIEYAYSKYPKPSEKTLIRYNVYYNLRHY